MAPDKSREARSNSGARGTADLAPVRKLACGAGMAGLLGTFAEIHRSESVRQADRTRGRRWIDPPAGSIRESKNTVASTSIFLPAFTENPVRGCIGDFVRGQGRRIPSRG